MKLNVCNSKTNNIVMDKLRMEYLIRLKKEQMTKFKNTHNDSPH